MKKIFTVGIIGSGRFGSLLFDVFARTVKDQSMIDDGRSRIDIQNDQNLTPTLPSLKGGKTKFIPKIFSRSTPVDNDKYFCLEEVCECDFLIPCVPISIFETQIENIKNLIKENTMVVDVCSVKLHPAKVLLEKLDQNVDLLLTHPMFGPDSSKQGTSFRDLKFIFEKTRIRDNEKALAFLDFWKDLGCKLFELSCEEHDRQAAFTHAFAFLVGRIGIEMGIREYAITTKGFDSLLYNQTAVENDSEHLFFDMFRFNPFVKEMLERFNGSIGKIEEKIKKY